MPLPVCCGKEMKVRMETGRFVEVKCDNCNDVVYVKKHIKQKPVMLDD
jgi:ribosomal protein S27E